MSTTTKPSQGVDRGSGRVGTVRLWIDLLRGMRNERWGEPSGYVFIFPGLALFLLFGIYPIYRGFELAFTDMQFLVPGYQPFVGINNFIEMFTQDTYFWPAFGRTLIFTGIYLPVSLGGALFSATVIASVKNGAVAAFFRSIVYLPVILPIAVAMLMWQNLLSNQYGMVNYLMRNVLGLRFLATDWLNNVTWALPSVAIARVWTDFGFATLLLLIGMYAISSEIYEAAALDGASEWQIWRQLTLPLLKPVLTIVFVLNSQLVSAAQEFMLMYGVGNMGPQQVGLTLGYYAYLLAFRWGNLRMGYAAAIWLFLGVLGMVVTAFVFRLMRTERN